MSISLHKPVIATVERLEVSKDLSGGAKIRMGDRAMILSPEQAVKFAVGILAAVGIPSEFKLPERPPS